MHSIAISSQDARLNTVLAMKHFDPSRWGGGGRGNRLITPLVRRCPICGDWGRALGGFCAGGCTVAEPPGVFLSLAVGPDLCMDLATLEPDSGVGTVVGDARKDEAATVCSPTVIESPTEDTQPDGGYVAAAAAAASTACPADVIDLTEATQPQPQPQPLADCRPIFIDSVDSGSVSEEPLVPVRKRSISPILVSAEERDRLRLIGKERQLERLRARAAGSSEARTGHGRHLG